MLVGTVENRQADLSMNLALTGAREKVIDYSAPYIGSFFLENFYCLILHGLNGVNSAELFECGTEVNQVYSNPGYAKEHRQRKMQKVHPCALCGHIFV